MPNLVCVCTTCDRHARPQISRSAGLLLARAFAAYLDTLRGHGLEVREVACLNGYLKPCNVAFRGANRQTVRFSRVDAADIPALVAFGQRYWAAAEGFNVTPGTHELAAKVSVIVPAMPSAGRVTEPADT